MLSILLFLYYLYFSVYKNKELNNNEIDSINQYLETKKFIYDFYQIELIDISSKNNENNDEINDDEIYKENEEDDDIINFGNIIRKIYINKIQSFNEVSSYYNKNDGNSKSKCLII